MTTTRRTFLRGALAAPLAIPAAIEAAANTPPEVQRVGNDEFLMGPGTVEINRILTHDDIAKESLELWRDEIKRDFDFYQGDQW